MNWTVAEYLAYWLRQVVREDRRPKTYQGYESVVNLGTPPHVVREILGHSAIEVTMTIYAHASLEEQRRALGKLGEVLGLGSATGSAGEQDFDVVVHVANATV